jgi:hypothetical protein
VSDEAADRVHMDWRPATPEHPEFVHIRDAETVEIVREADGQVTVTVNGHLLSGLDWRCPPAH